MRAAALLVLAGLASGCGKGPDAGFDWAANKSGKSGAVSVTLRRLSIQPNTDENMEREPTSSYEKTPPPGKGYYVACEFAIQVGGKPLWELPEGTVTALGPVDVAQGSGSGNLVGWGTSPTSKVPRSVRSDSTKRDAWYLIAGCRSPNLTERAPAYEVRFNLALKSGTRVNIRFPDLKPPPEAFLGR